jgi:hypothetical protein
MRIERAFTREWHDDIKFLSNIDARKVRRSYTYDLDLSPIDSNRAMHNVGSMPKLGFPLSIADHTREWRFRAII